MARNPDFLLFNKIFESYDNLQFSEKALRATRGARWDR
jgi:hypothetical protein